MLHDQYHTNPNFSQYSLAPHSSPPTHNILIQSLWLREIVQYSHKKMLGNTVKHVSHIHLGLSSLGAAVNTSIVPSQHSGGLSGIIQLFIQSKCSRPLKYKFSRFKCFSISDESFMDESFTNESFSCASTVRPLVNRTTAQLNGDYFFNIYLQRLQLKDCKLQKKVARGVINTSSLMSNCH